MNTNTAPTPSVAITTPASAGPAARAMLTPMLERLTAAGSCSRATSSGTTAWNEGAASAAPIPRASVKTSSSAGVIQPASVARPSASAPSTDQSCARISRRRRSSMSPSAPAGRSSRNMGSMRRRLHQRDDQRAGRQLRHQPAGADRVHRGADVGHQVGEPQRAERARASGAQRALGVAMRLDLPEQLVDAARHAGEEIRGVGVAERRRRIDRRARRSCRSAPAPPTARRHARSPA